MTYEKLPNGDYIVEFTRIWKDDTGVELEAKLTIMLSDIPAFLSYPYKDKLKNTEEKIWIDQKSMQDSYLVLCKYDEFKNLFHKYRRSQFDKFFTPCQ